MFVLAGADSLACLVLFWWPIDFPMGNRTIAIPTYLRGVFFAPLLQGLDVHSQAYYGISLRGIKLTGEVEEWGIILELCNIALTDVRFCDKGGWKEEELETVHYT